jgi:hypothetical protein
MRATRSFCVVDKLKDFRLSSLAAGGDDTHLGLKPTRKYNTTAAAFRVAPQGDKILLIIKRNRHELSVV